MGAISNLNSFPVQYLPPSLAQQATTSSDPQVRGAVNLLEAIAESVYQADPNAANEGAPIQFSLNGTKVALPNPFHRLDRLASQLQGQNVSYNEFLNRTGQFMLGAMGQTQLSTGQSVNVPALAQRMDAQATLLPNIPVNNAVTQAFVPTTDAGSDAGVPNDTPFLADAGGLPADPQPLDGAGTGGGVIDGMTNADMQAVLDPHDDQLFSAPEMAIYSKLSAPEQATFKLQKLVENHSRMVALLTNLLKLRHDTLMGIVNNIRGN